MTKSKLTIIFLLEVLGVIGWLYLWTTIPHDNLRKWISLGSSLARIASFVSFAAVALTTAPHIASTVYRKFK